MGRGGFGGSLGALRSEAVAKERNPGVLDSQRAVEMSMLISEEDPRGQAMVLTHCSKSTHVIT
jgi:hypothetical protein